jgi:hypothetical protein
MGGDQPHRLTAIGRHPLRPIGWIDVSAPARNDAAQYPKGTEMGFNPGLLDHVTRWAVGHKLAPGMAVLDVGTSELFCAADPPSLNRFLCHFGAEPYADDELGRRANGGLAADLFQRAGFDYMAIDFAVFPHTLQLDLNVDPLPLEQHSRYALVTNSGTSEHILNQYNVFKVIHDATVSGGLMYHGVPMAGEFSHGIISYNPKFFWSLAEANGYEIVRYWGWAAEKILPLAEDLAAQIAFDRPLVAQDAYLHVLLRRREMTPFRGLIDPAFKPG